MLRSGDIPEFPACECKLFWESNHVPVRVRTVSAKIGAPPPPARATGSDQSWFMWLVMLALFAGSVPTSAVAKARHVLFSLPAADAIIHGHHAEYVVRFDGPVDHRSAVLTIMQAGNVVQSLRPLLDSAPDVLFVGQEAPAPGEYKLHWEVRSDDGESTSGEIPFRIEP